MLFLSLLAVCIGFGLTICSMFFKWCWFIIYLIIIPTIVVGEINVKIPLIIDNNVCLLINEIINVINSPIETNIELLQL